MQAAGVVPRPGLNATSLSLDKLVEAGNLRRSLVDRLTPLVETTQGVGLQLWGVGCILPGHASRGVPLDSLALHLAALKLAARVNPDHLCCVIAEGVGKRYTDRSEHKEVSRRAEEHEQILATLSQLSRRSFKVVRDHEVCKWRPPLKAQDARMAYMREQVLFCETLRAKLRHKKSKPALKVGWSSLSPQKAAKVVARLSNDQSPSGACEGVVDTLAGVMGITGWAYAYISPARLASVRRHYACPYSTIAPEERIMFSGGGTLEERIPDPARVSDLVFVGIIRRIIEDYEVLLSQASDLLCGFHWECPPELQIHPDSVVVPRSELEIRRLSMLRKEILPKLAELRSAF